MSSSQPLACRYHSRSPVFFGDKNSLESLFHSFRDSNSVAQVSGGVSVFPDLLLVFKAPFSGAKEHRGTGERRGDPVLCSLELCDDVVVKAQKQEKPLSSVWSLWIHSAVNLNHIENSLSAVVI